MSKEAAPNPGIPSTASYASFSERLGLILKALLFVAVLVYLKIEVHQRDLEPISGVTLLTGLMGGVVFTLAILLAGTLADFKESERIVGELASQLRQLHVDLRPVATSAEELQEAHGILHRLVASLNANFRAATVWKNAEVNAALVALNTFVGDRMKGNAPGPQHRTIQVWLANIQRIVDRIEVIIMTTFMRAGYYLAGTVVLTTIVALTLTDLSPFKQGLFLFAFACFLLVGLFLLIWDLDNPFAGHARISTRQIEDLEKDLFPRH